MVCMNVAQLKNMGQTLSRIDSKHNTHTSIIYSLYITLFIDEEKLGSFLELSTLEFPPPDNVTGILPTYITY